MPEVPGDGVLLQVAYCGMCGSDVHIVEGELRVGPPPQVLGHEVSGTVVAVGSGVDDIAEGDRVACNYFGNCGHCAWCLEGQPNHCRNKVFGASGYAEFAAYRRDQVFVLPDQLGLDEGALLEPSATALYAVEESGLRPGEVVLVIGAGPIGLLTAQFARLLGAGRVVISELDAGKRELAKTLGFTDILDPATDNLRDVAGELGNRRGFDVVYDAAGSAAATEGALDLLATRGRLMIVAVHGRRVNLHIRPQLIYAKELVIKSANSTAFTFSRAVQLLPQLQLKPLISAVEPLTAIADVYRRHQAGEFAKVLLAPGDCA